ncbi:hypothetical protein SAMN05518672_10931 [Chitinophaga sp. CF118]|uniref:hypothetical protein n=1 Tax=Chitinophaga sp. CF118 TaxID=1884367 RepID=UPI0008F40E27|nr:hypothetical protein [Chitinophaga sp. CF118]SFE67363.1 hypothetical protein SAMN05518672_10931 [Chitinophaga sp. CF118]
MTYSSSIICLFAMLQAAVVSWNDPQGWAILKETIQKTPFSEVSKLRDRTFDMIVPGATNEYAFEVQPEKAFKVERLGPDKFRVIIINPEELVKRDLIVEYLPIGWQLNKIDSFKVLIVGKPNCRYNVRFSQWGVGELDLSKFDTSTYSVTYDLSNPQAILSIVRDGPGYTIERVPNSSVETQMRLRIKKKSGVQDLQTDWIAIPACKAVDSIERSAPPQVPPQQDPLREVNAMEFMVVKTKAISFCDDASGRFCTTLQVTVTNTGSKTIRCNQIWFYMKYQGNIVARAVHWVQLESGTSTSFQVSLIAASKPQDKWEYVHEKMDCFYK